MIGEVYVALIKSIKTNRLKLTNESFKTEEKAIRYVKKELKKFKFIRLVSLSEIAYVIENNLQLREDII